MKSENKYVMLKIYKTKKNNQITNKFKQFFMRPHIGFQVYFYMNHYGVRKNI